jgi:hypothetical protein
LSGTDRSNAADPEQWERDAEALHVQAQAAPARSAQFGRLLERSLRDFPSDAPMTRSKERSPLRCPACSSRAFAISGPTIRQGIVQCAACRTDVARLEEFMAQVEAEIERRERERVQRLH